MINPYAQTIHQKSVESFLKGIGRPVPDKPTAADPELQKTWARLLMEETLEAIEAAGVEVGCGGSVVEFPDLTFEAVGPADPTHLAKELADVEVVATGWMSLNGIKDAAILEIVDENNLLKVSTGHMDPLTGKFVKHKDHPKADPDVAAVLSIQSTGGI